MVPVAFLWLFGRLARDGASHDRPPGRELASGVPALSTLRHLHGSSKRGAAVVVVTKTWPSSSVAAGVSQRQLWRYGLEAQPAHACRVLPRRWAVERTFARLGHARRLGKDCERRPAVSEAMIHGAMIRPMLRRLTRTAA
jgi:transposase